MRFLAEIFEMKRKGRREPGGFKGEAILGGLWPR